MKQFTRFFCFFLVVFGLFGQSGRPYVLLVSFDGFRAEYLDWYHTPNFDRLAQQGVKAESMKPVFITKTFPNHYSIATGMYADHHGLIANTFYDAEFDATYRIRDRSAVEDARWYGGEPIWCTAEKQGVKTASYFWVGSESKAGGCQPTVWKRYDHDYPFEARIDSVVAWFQKPPKTRPHLVLLYFHEPDAAGHVFGPNSDETETAVENMDSVMGAILDRVKNLPVYKQLNIIVVSDHGMAGINPKRIINLNDYTDLSGFTQEGTGPTSFLYGGGTNRLHQVYADLKTAPHISVYLKTEIPNRLYYKNHYRIKDLLLIAHEGWSILNFKRPNPERYAGGTHGYDNVLPSMHAIFLADGPAFKNGYLRGTFENVNIYPLIANILQLTPNTDIDGNLENIADILSKNKQ